MELVDELDEMESDHELTLKFYFLKQLSVETISSLEVIRSISLANSVKQKNFVIDVWRSCINHLNAAPNHMVAYFLQISRFRKLFRECRAISS